MTPLRREDLIPYERYEHERQAFRRRIIELKRRRRISVGDLVTLVFENRDTIQFQVQEMLRIEHIVRPDKVQEELDVYNAMLPGAGELSATVLIEITDDARMQDQLDAFMGIDRGETVALHAGPHRVCAAFEGGHSNEVKISAVHFVKFRPDPSFVEGLAGGAGPVTVTVHHGAYRHEASVPEAMRQEWLADLRPERLSRVGS